MDEETKLAFEGVLKALQSIEDPLAGVATMARMNDGFERVLRKQHVLQVADDMLTQRVTQLEEDVRQLRGGI